MNNTTTFRARTVYISAFVIYFIIVGEVITTLVRGGTKAFLVSVCWGIFLGTCTYLLFLRPKVTFGDEGIIITNPFQEIQIGWSKIQSIETKYTMSIVVGGKNIYAWGAPAPSRYHSRNVHPTDIHGLGIGEIGSIRPGDSPRSDSGAASYLARTYMARFNQGKFKSCESKIQFNYIGATISLVSLILALSLYVLGF